MPQDRKPTNNKSEVDNLQEFRSKLGREAFVMKELDFITAYINVEIRAKLINLEKNS